LSQSDQSTERTEPDPDRDTAVRVPEPGERIGKYFVLDPIGEGAMGIVVRAYDPDLERSVAIKVVQPRLADPSRTEASRARLLNEARALARISHPNVVTVYEVGLHHGLIFVAMELVDGVDLQRWLKEVPRSWRAIVDAFEAAGRGLHQVHVAGLVHRDVKPANILVGNDGRVRMGDFGIARASFEVASPVIEGCEVADGFDLETTALTADGRVVGTLVYMAPEQHTGADVEPSADQYAFCVALYEALWGRRPFATDMRRLLAAKLAGPVLPVSTRKVPRRLAAIVARGLHPDPSKRFPSMVELCDALRTDPTVRPRRFAAIGAAAIAAGGAIALVVMRPGPCDDATEPLAGVWDASTRSLVEQVFTDSDRPWATEAWAHTHERLDAYSSEWTAMQRDACEATHVRGEQTAEQLDRRTVCLEGRRRSLAATTELLAAGGNEVVDHAFDLVGRLRPIAPCEDVIALASEVELPDDATLRAGVDELRTALARARALTDAGRFVEAKELAHQSTAAARELDYAPVVAESLALEGEMLTRAGKAIESRPLLEEGLWTAMGVGHDEVVVEAASSLVYLESQHEQSLVAALRWGELASATLRRKHSEDPHEYVRLENAIGTAQVNAAKYDEGLATFERALARIADDSASVARAGTIRHNIAIQWLERGELQPAREVLESLIADLEPVLGKDHPRLSAMRGTLAQVLGSTGENERAAELFRAEVDGWRLAIGEDSLQVAYARNNLGVVLSQLGKSQESIEVTELALKSFEREGDASGAATALVNLAEEYKMHGAHDAARSRFAQALELLEKLYPDGKHPDLVSAILGLASVQMNQGRFAEALVGFERGDKIIRESEEPNSRTRGRALAHGGEALVELHRLPEALGKFATQIEVYREAGDVLSGDLPQALKQHAHVLCELDRCAEALGELEEAAALARAAGLDRELAAIETERERALADRGRHAKPRNEEQ
jgi:tetratricopeptide (TPR) repeat protein/tRNA A-37 threonylcarbamoyl transferase component Bud32